MPDKQYCVFTARDPNGGRYYGVSVDEDMRAIEARIERVGGDVGTRVQEISAMQSPHVIDVLQRLEKGGNVLFTKAEIHRLIADMLAAGAELERLRYGKSN